MSWSAEQIKLAHIAAHQVGWNDREYHIWLQNTAGVRSSKDDRANMSGFRRFMALCEASGFSDTRGPTYWRDQAAIENDAMMNKIGAFHQMAVKAGIFAADGLPGFIEHQTKGRLQGPTTTLEECDALDLYRILEGLKGWGYREARKRGIRLDATPAAGPPQSHREPEHAQR